MPVADTDTSDPTATAAEESVRTWEAVAAFLGDPATHGLAEPVKRIDTHAAVVFLAGPLAYKIKRPVRFPFLDFSTLARRASACRREIDVDRPIAPYRARLRLRLRLPAHRRELGRCRGVRRGLNPTGAETGP